MIFPFEKGSLIKGMRNHIVFAAFVVLILGMAFGNLGAVVKKKNPILATQTDPVGYQDKVKEEEEGKKGPPVPSLNLFPKEAFLSDGPVGKVKPGEADETSLVESTGEVKEENGKDETSESDLWLDEDKETFKPDTGTDDTSEDPYALDETSHEGAGEAPFLDTQVR